MCGFYMKRNVSDRFWSKVGTVSNDNDDCWLWQARIHKGGYGQFWYDGRMIEAHRAAWMIAFGDIEAGMDVLHRCDVRSCVRPSHLFTGTQQDNMDDMLAKGRATRWKTTITQCPAGHDYSPENTRIRRDGSRLCRTCHRVRERARVKGPQRGASLAASVHDRAI